MKSAPEMSSMRRDPGLPDAVDIRSGPMRSIFRHPTVVTRISIGHRYSVRLEKIESQSTNHPLVEPLSIANDWERPPRLRCGAPFRSGQSRRGSPTVDRGLGGHRNRLACRSFARPDRAKPDLPPQRRRSKRQPIFCVRSTIPVPTPCSLRSPIISIAPPPNAHLRCGKHVFLESQSPLWQRTRR